MIQKMLNAFRLFIKSVFCNCPPEVAKEQPSKDTVSDSKWWYQKDAWSEEKQRNVPTKYQLSEKNLVKKEMETNKNIKTVRFYLKGPGQQYILLESDLK